MSKRTWMFETFFLLAFRKSASWYPPRMLRCSAFKSLATLGGHEYYTFKAWRSLEICYGEGVMNSRRKLWATWHTITLMCRCQGNYECKSVAAICTTDIEAPWFCLHSIGLLNKICSLSGMCFLFIKKKETKKNLWLIQALLITLILEELQVRRRGKEAEMLKCVSIWRANGWSVCYRVEWSAGRWLLQKRQKSGGQMCTGRNADTPSSSQMLMFTLVISIKSSICRASFWLYLSSKSLHMTGIKKSHLFTLHWHVYALHVWM